MKRAAADKLTILRDMGVSVWLSKDRPPTQHPDATQTGETLAPPVASQQQATAMPAVEVPKSVDRAALSRSQTGAAPLDPARLNWEQLQKTVSVCTACDLHRGRSQTVFGTGDRQARWMLIGEAPGAEEDRRGEPFIGRAGQLLTAMLAATGLQRNEVYISNIVKCRPPDNRDPRNEEAACCAPFLQRQIALVQPELIIALGRVAAQRLLQTDTPVGKLRGKLHQLGTKPGIPLIVTYHPAYLLRSPRQKLKAWQDLQFAMEQAPPRP